MESADTLVHSFVASRIDYCNAVLAGAPKATTNKLQRVLNAAARMVSGMHKFDRGLSRLLHTELHWLDVPERVVYTVQARRHGVQLPARSSDAHIKTAQQRTSTRQYGD